MNLENLSHEISIKYAYRKNTTVLFFNNKVIYSIVKQFLNVEVINITVYTLTHSYDVFNIFSIIMCL